MENGKKIMLTPFQHAPRMTKEYADDAWQVLEDAIHKIHSHNSSRLSFEELYRNGYNMVLHRFGEKLYNGLTQTLRAHLEQVAAGIESSRGESFLREMEQSWEEHLKSTQMIRDILMYMDRTYVNQHRKTPVFQLGLDLWYEVVIRRPVISDRLRGLILDMIHRERVGELVEKSLIRSMTKMFVSLGHDVYRREFEVHFLEVSADFYKKEAGEYLSSNDCPEYLRRAERRFQEEEERVRNYLDESSKENIIKVLQSELIATHMVTLVEMETTGEVALLQDNMFEDLSRMYTLFSKVDGGLDLVKNTMMEHVKSRGCQLVNDAERIRDPVGYVFGLLELREKYEEIIKHAFNDDKNFRHALNTAFEYFINQNPRSPEFVSLFIDDKLRRGQKEYTDKVFDDLLDKVMTIFRFLQEKDVFEKYYKQHLAKRLLCGRSFSDQAEGNLLVKLKTECGYQFTSKLESMFNDIKMSEDIQKDFRDSMNESNVELGLDFTVRVLTTGSWPAQSAAQCRLPEELHGACEEFEKFYLRTRTGRKLTWQANMGTVDVVSTFSGKKHLLVVSTYQACVLNMFNDADELTFHEMADATGIPPQDLKRHLIPLVGTKGKQILIKSPAGKEITDQCVFTVNDKFSSKLYRVKIASAGAMKETEPEKQDTRAKVEEDRKPQIEAAIVRIMKARRVLDHHSVIAEVTRQLSARFNPNPIVIKKRIESLIEREFIERDQNDRKLYRYLA